MRFYRTGLNDKPRLHNDFQGAQDLFTLCYFRNTKTLPSFECTKNQLCFCQVNTYFTYHGCSRQQNTSLQSIDPWKNFDFFPIFPHIYLSWKSPFYNCSVVKSTTFQYCGSLSLSLEQGRSVKGLFVQRIFSRNGHLTFALIRDHCNVQARA